MQGAGGHRLSGNGHGEGLPRQLPLGLVGGGGEEGGGRTVSMQLQPFSLGVHGQAVHGDAGADIASHIGRVVLGGSRVTTGAQGQGTQQTEGENQRFFHGNRPLGRVVSLYLAGGEKSTGFCERGGRKNHPRAGGSGVGTSKILHHAESVI